MLALGETRLGIYENLCIIFLVSLKLAWNKNLKIKLLSRTSDIPVLNNHTLLAATVLESEDMKYSHHHRKFWWTVLYAIILKILVSGSIVWS